MGSVCASTMSLLNAGRAAEGAGRRHRDGPGLRTRSTARREYVTLTDILGAEDAFGDMDFKVAGTREFVTALQLDTKLDGIPSDGAGRRAAPRPATPGCTILDVMTEAIDAPDEMSPYAPRIITVKIPVDKIGEVIGPKGKMINSIQEETGAEIAIEDDGTIYIGAADGAAGARRRSTVINAIANPRCRRSASASSARSSRRPPSVRSSRCCPAGTACVHISQAAAAASGSTRSRTSSTSATSCRWRSPRSTPAARSAWSRSSRTTAAAPAAPAATGELIESARRPPPAVPRRSATAAAHAVLPTGPATAGASGAPSLPGGLRVVTEAVPAVRSARVGVWVGVGSRDETPPLAGASHYLEHLLFKGTGRRSALEIAVAVDAVGGEINAFTAKEYTCYYARVLDADLPLAVDVVCDVVTVVDASRPTDVDTERGVILEEIAMRDDDPGDAGARPVRRGALRRHPARPAGDRHGRVHRARCPATAIAGYYRRRYRPAAWSSPSPAASTTPTWCGWVRRAFGAGLDASATPRRPRRAAPGPAGRRVRRSPAWSSATRAGAPRARRARRWPGTDDAPLRARRAATRARRRA